jgi:hypothetical protein
MPKKSRPLNLDDFDAIDWDAEDAQDSNLAHCLRHDIDRWAVDAVLADDWIDVEIVVERAEFAIVGPYRRWNRMLTLLFDTSGKQGNWLRPVTGWESKPKELKEWERVTKETWGGRRVGSRKQQGKG